MKYWVYKDSRILGPFDKDAVAGLPGLDASTLVSAGDSAGAGEGEWRPAGDVSEFSGLSSVVGPSWAGDDFGSTYGLLDKLQLDAAGLIGDDDFPGAAEDLFQDADMKKTFGDLLTPRPPANEAELRRAKDQVSELTLQLEMLYRRVSELESGQTNLVHRLVEKEIALRGHPPQAAELDRDTLAKEIVAALAHPPPPPAPVQTPAPVAPAPAPSAAPAPQAAAAPAPVFPPPVTPPADWPSAAPGGAFPSFAPIGGARQAPPPPVVPVPAPVPEQLSPEAAPLPPMPPLPPPAIPPLIPPVEAAAPPSVLELSHPAPVPPPQEPPKKSVFERKTFKVAPTIKAFRVVGPEEASPAGFASAPAPEAAAPAPVAPPVPEPAAPAFVPPAPVPPPAPVLAAPPVELKAPAPVELATPPAPETAAPGPSPAPFDWSAPAAPLSLAPAPSKPQPLAPPSTDPAFSLPSAAITPAFEPSSAPATPMPAPPATLSFGAPPSFAPQQQMPSFAGAGGGESMNTAAQMAAPSTQEVMARLGKPAPETAPPPVRPARNNKTFLIAGAVLVALMAVIGYFSLRHPKDLKQMAELDDGRSSVGYAPVDEGSKPPMIKPKQAAPAASAPNPAPAPAEAPQAATESKLDAAVAMVKDFPLDGGRGTVASWLQYSYSASPGAGKESWSASETGDKDYLVEYRFTPSAAGSPEVHYLFEADMNLGVVIGKNLDAKSMLAGGPRGVEEKPKARAKTKKKPARAKPSRRAQKRPVETETPKEVPLLPLPNEGELRPPAEDDGAFRSDTVNSGL